MKDLKTDLLWYQSLLVAISVVMGIGSAYSGASGKSKVISI